MQEKQWILRLAEENAELKGNLNIYEAELENANIVGVRMSSVYFRESTLTEANLTEVDLKDAQLVDIDLTDLFDVF